MNINKNKSCLVLCPSLFKRLPLIGFAYLYSYIRSAGFEVEVFDINASYDWPHNDEEEIWGNKDYVEKFYNEHKDIFEQIAHKIINSNVTLVGFSIWASTKLVSLALAKTIKDKNKEILIVFGGPECSFSGEELIRNESVDVVVLGEGEQALLEIHKLLNTNMQIEGCAGTITKKHGEIVCNPPREEILDLDRLSFPDYSVFDLKRYNISTALPISFGRGCIRRCVFCNTHVSWSKLRVRKAANILAEMKTQIKKHPHVRKFEVDDTALNLNPEMLSELCDLMIKNNVKIKWGGSGIIRKDMTRELLFKMARAGCNCIGYGLESGSQKIIDLIGKGFKIEDADKVIKDTFEAGIETILQIIIGFPGETDEDFSETLNFIERNKSYISWVHAPSECTVNSNTYMNMFPDKFGIVVPENGKWYSKSGGNNHDERQKRINIFNEFLNKAGVTNKHYTQMFTDNRAEKSSVVKSN